MSLKGAMNLIRDAGKNPGLRKELYTVPPAELSKYLKAKGYFFDYSEFEESVNLLHVKCQTKDEADELMHVVLWFRLLSTMTN